MKLPQDKGWFFQGDQPVVLSSRIRFARNLADWPFEPLDKENLRIMQGLLESATAPWAGWEESSPREMEPVEKQILLERGLLEPEFALQDPGLLMVSPDNNQVVTLGEGDHWRYSLYGGGQTLETLFQDSRETLASLEQIFPPAFSPDLGYLRADPRNCGTAMKPSVLLHLPASEITGMITEVLKQAESQGYSIRGLWEGDETESSGVYQLAPYFSTGTGETAALLQLVRLCEKISTWEGKSRELLLAQQPDLIQDLCGRAYGILKHGRRLSLAEGLSLVSRLRLGVILGIIKDIPLQALNPLRYLMQKGHLRRVFPEDGSTEEDILRARLVRARLWEQ